LEQFISQQLDETFASEMPIGLLEKPEAATKTYLVRQNWHTAIE
jgi:hypothetical protein